MNFPNSPALNDTYTLGTRTWQWDGVAWNLLTPNTTPTASATLESIKTVDGAGSGLDADLLDGQHGSYYLDLANQTGLISPTQVAPGTYNVDISGAVGGYNVNKLSSLFKAQRNLSGGGTLTVDASATPYVLWSARFIVIANGRSSQLATAGYWDITCPTSGTITAVGGATTKTATAAGIPLNQWDALYYILPVGFGSASVAANFRVVGYQSDFEVPPEWLLICIYNGDNSTVYFNNGYNLKPGQSINTATYDARNADLLDGNDSTYYTNASNLASGTVATARLGSGTANNTTWLRGDGTWQVGPLGYTGSQGTTGFTGSVGFVGSQGVQGVTGFTGSVGFVGSASTVQGPTGFTGSVGFVGSQGIQGVTGFTGSVGFVGSASTVAGPTGFTGSVGFVGSQGIQGVTGFTGSVGFVGSRGNTGFTGSQGTTGFTGSVGFVGSASTVQGPTGFTGSTGKPWLAISTATTLSSNVGYLVNTSGGPFSVTLPATPATGDIIELQDAGNWLTNNLTVLRNGKTIEGVADDLLLNVDQLRVSLVYDGTTWQVAANLGPQGPAGTAINDVFWENTITISQNYTISANKNAGSFGPITIADGITVEIPDGSTWSIV